MPLTAVIQKEKAKDKDKVKPDKTKNKQSKGNSTSLQPSRKRACLAIGNNTSQIKKKNF